DPALERQVVPQEELAVGVGKERAESLVGAPFEATAVARGELHAELSVVAEIEGVSGGEAEAMVDGRQRAARRHVRVDGAAVLRDLLLVDEAAAGLAPPELDLMVGDGPRQGPGAVVDAEPVEGTAPILEVLLEGGLAV